MPKFFVNNEQINDDIIVIKGQDVNHISKVLRAKIGDELQICNSYNGKNFLCDIEKIDETEIYCKIIEELTESIESNIKVTIFQGLPKADKMEYIIQKSVELGVYDIVPVEMKRCVVKLTDKDKVKKIDRWQKISEVAAKQCGRDIIPKINNVENIKNICNLIKSYDIVLVAYENEKENSIKSQLQEFKEHINKDNSDVKIGVVIGPEGGLEQADVEELEKCGAKIITLGKRILRTETVSLNILSVLMYELEK